MVALTLAEWRRSLLCILQYWALLQMAKTAVIRMPTSDQMGMITFRDNGIEAASISDSEVSSMLDGGGEPTFSVLWDQRSMRPAWHGNLPAAHVVIFG
eukprot:g46321.t1